MEQVATVTTVDEMGYDVGVSGFSALLQLRQGSSARATWILDEVLGGTMISVGSDPACDWQIRAAFVPARAFSILVVGGKAYVRSGPELGVLLNGRPLDDGWTPVAEGARIDVGLARVEVKLGQADALGAGAPPRRELRAHFDSGPQPVQEPARGHQHGYGELHAPAYEGRAAAPQPSYPAQPSHYAQPSHDSQSSSYPAQPSTYAQPSEYGQPSYVQPNNYAQPSYQAEPSYRPTQPNHQYAHQPGLQQAPEPAYQTGRPPAYDPRQDVPLAYEHAHGQPAPSYEPPDGYEERGAHAEPRRSSGHDFDPKRELDYMHYTESGEYEVVPALLEQGARKSSFWRYALFLLLTAGAYGGWLALLDHL